MVKKKAGLKTRTKKSGKRKSAPRPTSRGRISKYASHLPGDRNGGIADATAGGKSRRRASDDLFNDLTRSSIAIMGGLHDYNPDDLVINKGIGVRVYQDMRRDPYVKAALNIKKFSVARSPAQILPASPSAEDQEIAKFVEWNLENMDISVDTLLWGIMDAVDIGYSIGEMTYKIVDDGRFKGKVAVRHVKSKDPYVYTFKIDEFGNIDKVIQRISGGYVPSTQESLDFNPTGLNIRGEREFDPSKFLIMSFQPLYSNPYGQSDLRAAYRAFFIKDFAWKFRAIFMEKWGMPPVLGRFPNGTPESRRKQFEEVLDSIQNDTVITIPEDLKVEILNLVQAGRTTEYERAIADLNKEILIGIMGSFLSVEEGKRTGARAQGEVHFSVSKLFIEHLACILSDALNKSYIRPLVDLNFRVTEYPKHRFDTTRVEELLKDIMLDKELTSLGVPIDSAYFYKKYGRPTPAENQTGRYVGRDPLVPGRDPGRVDLPDQIAPVPGSSQLRQGSIPEDPRQIGKLRETWAWIFQMWEANGRKGKPEDYEEAAFELAGRERKFREKHGRWMDSDEAHLMFLGRIFRE